MGLLATAMLGCQLIRSPQPAVVDAVVTQQSDHGARVEVTIELTNPNAVPLPLKKSHYTLAVEGADVCSLSERHHVAVPAVGNGPASTAPPPGRQRLTLPAVIVGPRENLVGKPFEVYGTVSYEPPGEIRKLLTESHVPLPVVYFTGKGRIAAPTESHP